MDLVIVIAGSASVVVAVMLAWWAVSGPAASSTVELHDGTPDLRARVLERGVGDRVAAPALARFGTWVGERSPSGRLRALDRRLARAGSPEGWTVERLLTVKVLLAAVAGGTVALFVLESPSILGVGLAAGAAGLGWFVPDAVLDRVADRRRNAIRAELSDVIDQLSMMVHSGLGVDAAIARAARASTGPMAQELARVGHDVRVGVDRSVALANLAERVDVAELHSFVAALSQAERLGVPVARTLQIQAGELRLKRRQLAEERAMKLPVKLLFPMVFCIFPTLLIVLLAPAVIQIVRQLG